jgi:hypothetical protein
MESKQQESQLPGTRPTLNWRYLSEDEIDELLSNHRVHHSSFKEFEDVEELTTIVNSLRRQLIRLRESKAPHSKRLLIRAILQGFSFRLQEVIETSTDSLSQLPSEPPLLGERILLLILTKEDRVNIPGDLAEEFSEIAAKHGNRYAELWYYKQVAASAWPMIRKAIRWSLLASVGEFIRRII